MVDRDMLITWLFFVAVKKSRDNTKREKIELLQ